MINTNKEIIYKFFGVDFRTELLLGFIAGFLCILFWFGFLFCYYEYFDLDSILRISKQIFFFCMFSGLLICLIILRFMGIYCRSLWHISEHQNQFIVSFKKYKWVIEKKNIQKIEYIGNESFRYLSFISDNHKVKIRVGYNVLTPFSRKEDLEILEKFIESIKPFLFENFSNKNKKIIRFDNQGVYLKNNNEINARI